MADESTIRSDAAPTPVLIWLGKQIDWYRTHADGKMRMHELVKIAQILGSFLITAAALVLSPDRLKVVAGVSAAALAALGGFAQAFGFQQSWIRWRNTQMKLEAERDLYVFGAGPYASFADPSVEARKAALLVERCQAIAGQELQQWIAESATSRKPEQGASNPAG